MIEYRKQINHAVACVIEFANKYDLSVNDAFQFLFQYKAIEFLKENYDIEHTLSLDDALADMRLICQNNGGSIHDLLPQNKQSKCNEMTKQKQLVEYNIQDIIEYIMIDNDMEYDAAMQVFFNSKTFEKLMDIETGLYRESSAYVYSLYCDEMTNGKFIQNEI